MTASGLVPYYMGNGQEAYYFDDIRQEGRWEGKAVAKLNLPPTITRPEFHHLLLGYSPDGQNPLVQNAGHPKRDAAWDLTFSAPKSVSVLWALAPEPVRKEIEQAHHEAVREALAYVEDVAGLTRRGKGGVIKERADLLFGTFFHGESRAHDPNIHSHAVLVNLGLRQDGTTGALWTMDIFRAKMKAGEHYRQALAKKLTERLHLGLLPERVGFHVRGVPKDLCVVFSQRSRALRKVMKERGLSGAVAAKMATLLTRPEKEHLPEKEFFARCHEVARGFGWGREEARQLVEHGPTEKSCTESQPTHNRRSEDDPAQPHTAAHESPEQDRPHTAAQTAPPEQSASQRPASTTEESTGTQDQRRSRDRQAGSEDTIHQASKEHTEAELQRTKSKGISQEENRDQKHSGRTQATAESKARQNTKDHTQAERQRAKSKRTSQEHQGRRARRGPASSKNTTDQKAQEHTREKRTQAKSKGNSQRKTRGARRQRSQRGASQKRSYQQARHQSQTQTKSRFSPPPPNDRWRMEWRRVFPKAPFWSPAKFVKVPVLSPPDAQSPWGNVLWQRKLGTAELQVQWRRLFPNAPQWSLFRGLKLPALRLTPPAWAVPAAPQPKWWTMHAKAETRFGEFRVQSRHPFRHAPRWSPLRNVKIPALRFTRKKSVWTRLKHHYYQQQERRQRMHQSH